VEYQSFIYPGVEHGFNNDTTPRFDEAAAKLAWERTITLFNRVLRG
jgi:carboxymethylenebutenolidase